VHTLDATSEIAEVFEDLEDIEDLDLAAPAHAQWESTLDGSSVADEEIQSYVARATGGNFEAISALSAFQRRMDRYPQLSPEAQVELVRDYQRGVSAQEVLADPVGLPRDERRRLQELARRSEYAVEHLVGSNFRLVWLIVRENAENRYGRERATDHLPDLMNEANVAVVEAVRDFDPARCPTFHTYLARVVRDRVRMVLTKDGPIGLSPSWSRLKRIVSVRIPALEAELNRRPTQAEIQEDLLERCMEWAESKLSDEQRALPAAKKRELKLAKLRKQGMLGAIRNLDKVLVATQTVASLDTPMGDDGSSSLGDLLPGQSSDSTFDRIELDEVRASLAQALATLTDREREIILFRFGFFDGENWTYARIAERYDVTAERIRQIEKNVLVRLGSGQGQYSALTGLLPSQAAGR
jgi:RNA polymerase primary sigma factor